MSYCFDTSAFVEAWRRRYPIQLFPDFWDRVDEMARDGNRVFANEEVRAEIERIDDDLLAWIRARPHLILVLDDAVQARTTEILRSHSRLMNLRKNRSMADPFVIAHAPVLNAAVVTEERLTESRKAPRIPDVCRAIGVECIDVVTFMRRENMVFRLR